MKFFIGTHKIRKQHYTSKIYENIAPKSNEVKSIKSEDRDKLIEDVFIALEGPIKKNRNIEKTDDKKMFNH